MARIIFIPSYGTDSTLYAAIKDSQIIGYDCIYTEWLKIQGKTTLSDYASNFIDYYKIEATDILVGTSLGGVLAIEIQKIFPVKKIIIISSIKSVSEQPKLFRFLRKTKLYRLFLPQVLKFGLDVVIPLYGKNVKSYLWFRKVFKNSDNAFLRWGLKEIVNWKNTEIPDNLIHIHGSKDPLFPLKNSKAPQYVIEGGSHAMIRFKAKEIAEIINHEIS